MVRAASEGEDARGAAGFAASFAAAARRDRVLWLIALIALASGFAVQPVSGRHPDWPLLLSVLGNVWMIFGALALMAITAHLVWLAAIRRSPRPTRDLLSRVMRFAAEHGRGATAIHTFAIFVTFACGFAVLKIAIGLAAPFRWDTAFAELDRALHFGRYPHEWLAAVTARPLAVSAINVAYHLWFFVQVGSIVLAAATTRRHFLRHQYLMSYMLVWLIGGFAIAVAFSSAGPVYFERLGLGTDYAPLMARLHAAAAQYPVWALEVQETLWAGYTGARPGTGGISAFPSMHVATATLFVLAARRIDPGLYVAAALFWLVTMIGSVVLAWHYAVDGYASTLLAVVIWKLAGAYGHRRARSEPDPARLPA